ncbi:MAG: hypothetical protein M3Z85_16945 [Acidobacteriota bacterium]|nr:hypothetical protein [Acidobacteriota bacterium]
MKHLSEADLALYAGGDLGWLFQKRAGRHIAGCAECQAAAVEFSAARAAIADCAESAESVALPWSRMAGEMKANIRLGLEAGECVGLRRPPVRLLGARVGIGIAFASLAILVGANFWLREAAPRTRDDVVLESTGGGIQVREGGQVLSILNSRGNNVIRTVSAQGEMRARYVDSRTGLLTINNVYAQ